MDNRQMVDNLQEQGYLNTDLIIQAFLKTDRADFVPQNVKDQAYANHPLPIGYGQTISQPATVALMLELLQPQPGQKILDIGAGSGWQTALLAYCVGRQNAKGKAQNGKQQRKIQNYSKGKVFAIELVPALKEFGERNVSKYNFTKKGIIEFLCQDGKLGLPEQAPFDRIIAAASGPDTPVAWQQQLKIGGRLVMPIGHSIWLYEKMSSGQFIKKEFPGFIFVPLK